MISCYCLALWDFTRLLLSWHFLIFSWAIRWKYLSLFYTCFRSEDGCKKAIALKALPLFYRFLFYDWFSHSLEPETRWTPIHFTVKCSQLDNDGESRTLTTWLHNMVDFSGDRCWDPRLEVQNNWGLSNDSLKMNQTKNDFPENSELKIWPAQQQEDRPTVSARGDTIWISVSVSSHLTHSCHARADVCFS